jgi:hypothetical protein
MEIENKITIIEGPTPTFETVQDGWALGLNEGPFLYDLAITQLRTFNGNALVERCHRAWRNGATMYLEYRSDVGLTMESPILAARTSQTSEGFVLFLWIRRDHQETSSGLSAEDDEDSNRNLL